jgi:Flp pilus assembly protein TadB
MAIEERDMPASVAQSRTRIHLPGRTLVVIAALMVLTAALFWAASAVEKKGAHPSVSVQTHAEETSEEAPVAAPEGSSARESEEAAAGQPERQVLGINLEAAWVPYAVAIETEVLVAALILLGSPVLFLVNLLAIAGTQP